MGERDRISSSPPPPTPPGRDCDEPPSLAHPDPSCHVRMRLEGTLDEDRCNPDFCPCDEFVSQPSTSTDGRCPSCGGTLHYSNGTGWCPVCPGTLVLRPATDRHRLLEDFYAAYVAMQEAEGAPALLEHTEPRSQAYFDAVDARIAARSRFDKANKALRETS